MNTVYAPSLSASPASQGPGRASDPTPALQGSGGSRALAAMLLAAVVAALVVLADQMISTWADDHLLLAWVALWAVIFASSVLLSGPARRLAHSTLRSVRDWSVALAEARTEMQIWNAARSDPRLMAELMLARQRHADANAEAGASPAAAAWGRYPERLAESRDGHTHLHHA